MMLKQKSSPWARLKYLYVLPLTAVAVVAFARPEISRELEKISSTRISEITPVEVTNPTDTVHTVRVPLNIQEAMQKQLDDFSKASENIVRAVRHSSINNVSDTLNIRINNINSSNEPLIIVDGEELLGDRTLDSIDVNTIESISVIKDERALELYGEKARNGVILITRKIGKK